VPPGVYLLRGVVGSEQAIRRIVRVR